MFQEVGNGAIVRRGIGEIKEPWDLSQRQGYLAPAETSMAPPRA